MVLGLGGGPEHQEPPRWGWQGVTQALGQEEGHFPSRPPPLWVSSDCGNARHVPGLGTQALYVPTPGEDITLPFASSLNPHKSQWTNPGQETLISYSLSSTAVNIPHTQGTPSREPRACGGVRVMEGLESLPEVRAGVRARTRQ